METLFHVTFMGASSSSDYAETFAGHKSLNQFLQWVEDVRAEAVDNSGEEQTVANMGIIRDDAQDVKVINFPVEPQEIELPEAKPDKPKQRKSKS